MTVRLKPGPSKLGVCRICGCTDTKPCLMRVDFLFPTCGAISNGKLDR